ncbi:hypothetical protein [uncultured Draconibacterium sp.]|uniref:hypothetical protein n=1 Tax=uncultured Draconibacterium sp. TaxID=1573823 RepID=UPI003216CF29
MVIKIAHIVLLASVKYIVTLPYAMIIGLEYKYAILSVLGGGIGGFLFFYYVSKQVNRKLECVWPQLCNRIPPGVKAKFRKLFGRHKKPQLKKIFTKKSRSFIRFKKSYGLWGIVIATPVLLTIPVGAFLASKYYSHQKHIVVYMILSIIGWGVVLSGLVHLFPRVFF